VDAAFEPLLPRDVTARKEDLALVYNDKLGVPDAEREEEDAFDFKIESIEFILLREAELLSPC
jgi:hypothetical protein